MSSLKEIYETYKSASVQQIDKSLNRRISDLTNVFRLMSHGVALTSNGYCYLSQRQDALRRFCTVLIKAEVVNYTELNRVAHLLSLPESLALKEQILVAKSAGKDEVMVCSYYIINF